jgi:DUF4097 and DUF4098 domain-containing protein YvlB
MNRTFDTPGSPSIRVRIPSGKVSISAAVSDETVVDVEVFDGSRPVDGGVKVEMRGSGGGQTVIVEATDGRFQWRRREYRVSIRCPERSNLELKTASAEIEGRGRLGSLDVTTASGDVRFERLDGDVRAVTASGHLQIDEAGSQVHSRGASGDITIGRAAGPVDLARASGDIRIRRAVDTVKGRTVSGGLDVEAAGGGSVLFDTVSGDVSVGVMPGVDVWLDLQSLSGNTVSELTPTEGPQGSTSSTIEVRLKSVSGDLRVHRAEANVLESA